MGAECRATARGMSMMTSQLTTSCCEPGRRMHRSKRIRSRSSDRAPRCCAQTPLHSLCATTTTIHGTLWQPCAHAWHELAALGQQTDQSQNFCVLRRAREREDITYKHNITSMTIYYTCDLKDIHHSRFYTL